MAATAAGPSKLQQLGRDDLLKLLKKQAEQQKTLKEQLAVVTKEKDDALAQLSIASTSNGRAETPGSDNKQELEDLRTEFEAKLAKEKFASQEVNSSLKAMQMELADYDKQVKNFKEEKASMASRLESALKDRDEFSKRLVQIEEELSNTKQFSEDLEKALSIAKAEAEELRLQKQDAESQRIELMQTKMNEDSHSTKQVMDLTNELSQTSQQIETLRSSLASVKSQRDNLAAETKMLNEKLNSVQDDHAKYMAKTKLMYDDTWKNMLPSNYDNLNHEIAQLKQKLEAREADIEKLNAEATSRAEDSVGWAEKLARSEREANKWKTEADSNMSSLTRAMDDLRELRSRYESAMVEEKNRGIQALEREKQLQQGNLDKVFHERKQDLIRYEQQDFQQKSEIDTLKRERDDLQKKLDTAQKAIPSSSTPTPVTPSHQQRYTESREPRPVQQTYSSISDFRESPEPIPETTLHDVLFGEKQSDRVEGSIFGDESFSLATISEVKDTLKVAEQQNTTLRELLADSEGQNELYSNQISVLKEEIRRIQRNSERENHINNTEYIKNIIFQFMRPEKVAGERRQLLNILRTMLQLSDEEYRTMYDMTTEAASPDASSSSGFSSFFHRWNGL
ncbi:unnamed protein product, partial [Mesorhabditis spiculigera]